MGADLSRVRFNPLLDYAGVELQQGRVMLDGDANELAAILDRRLRALASDVLGRATVSSTTPDAFKIAVAGGTLQIAKGRLYVDGLLAENHGAVSVDPAKRIFDDLMSEPQFADPIAYPAQPYLPNPPALPTTGHRLVYLDVWDREVTPLENPDLVETALGVDTTARVQTVWQVRVLDGDVGTGIICTSLDTDIPGWSTLIAASTGVLTTGTFDAAPVDDPCELPPSGGYRGLENQTYRIEIHDPGQPGAGATFKWSRENSSVGSRVASIVSGGELQLETLGRDDVLRFNTGDWVEITDDIHEFAQIPGEIRKVTVIDATRRIQFSPALPAGMLPGTFPDSDLPRTRNLRVRRWDQKGLVFRTVSSGTPVQVQDLDAGGSTGLVAVPAAGTALLLENGVTVSFDSTGAKGFRPGDYWVFAARTANASVELLDRAPPRGIHHHYARLGIWDVGAGQVSDCRHPWPPKGGDGHDCSCQACVTVESHQSGQFTIQDGVNQLRVTGGTLCLGPGHYALKEPVSIRNGRSLCIRGEGPATLISAAGTAFVIENCIAVGIEKLAILSLRAEQSAIAVSTAIGLSLRQLVIAELDGNAQSAAISLQGIVVGASISENVIFAPVAILANDPAVPATNKDVKTRFLVTGALAIEDNIILAQTRAVSLQGIVLHLLSTRICGNEILGCSQRAISALGLGAPGSSITISRNSIAVTGSGIVCDLDGLLIEGNKVVNSATTTAARAAKTVGIGLATGLDRNGSDQCQILSNQISGFGGFGIAIGAPSRDLIVKLNIIEKCGNGILSTDDADGGSVSIENNHIQDIGPFNETGTASATGIGISRAESATIAGNMIRRIGAQSERSTLRAGIMTVGVDRARITGNEVTEIAPPGDFLGLAAGIVLRSPFTEFDVNHNRVQRDAAPSDQQTNSGTWMALAVIGLDSQNPVSHTGDVSVVKVDNNRMMVLGAGRPYIASFDSGNSDATATQQPELARGSVIGNVFYARGNAPAVDIFAPGECLFNDNRVEARLNGKLAVRMATSVAIVNANRVRGGEVSIQVSGAKTAAVLGNVTTGSIDIPGGLQPPWDALNLRG